jgi:hypothetical protein
MESEDAVVAVTCQVLARMRVEPSSIVIVTVGAAGTLALCDAAGRAAPPPLLPPPQAAVVAIATNTPIIRNRIATPTG